MEAQCPDGGTGGPHSISSTFLQAAPTPPRPVNSPAFHTRKAIITTSPTSILWCLAYSGALLGFVPSLHQLWIFVFAEMSVKESALKYMEMLEDKLRR